MIYTVKGIDFESNLTNEVAIATIRPQARKSGFVESILHQYQVKGDLSAGQWAWVHKIATDVLGEQAPKDTTTPFTTLQDMFQKNGNCRASVIVRTTVGDLTVSKAPSGGNNAGCLYVKLGGEYAGKITPDGSFRAVVKGDAYHAVYNALVEFSKNPQEVAAKYGKETGVCCFCGRQLTDERSVEVGYGPICADNWGLPWGEVTKEKTALAVKLEEKASLVEKNAHDIRDNADSVDKHSSRYISSQLSSAQKLRSRAKELRKGYAMTQEEHDLVLESLGVLGEEVCYA
jgi:hypothetical protein